MNLTQMKKGTLPPRFCIAASRRFLTLAATLLLIFSTAVGSFAQKSFNRRYPVSGNVRLELTNRGGSIEVETWTRNEIKISADIDSPGASLTPRLTGNGLIIDVVSENRGRDEVGDINFRIYVPVNSAVDIETRRGNITVRGVQGERVRARVSSEGRVELTDIHAISVIAENNIGDIFFDGELRGGGAYEFKSSQGMITISIPEDSAFRLVATAPLTKSIALGMFSNAGLSFVSEGRKVVGSVGDGRAALNITNYRGKISFIRR